MGNDLNVGSKLLHEYVVALEETFGRGEVELNALRVLSHIAIQRGPIGQQDLVQALGLSEAAISRNLKILGVGHTMDVPGPRLVETYTDPTSARKRLCRLTGKGIEFMQKLTKISEACRER